mmetsp:Transcript_12785/g.19923  ORF Transcript_12785/g.19923 Transcript_12785/m.19923 type:complete len:103 (-) Transcript_12785:509-817(-)
MLSTPLFLFKQQQDFVGKHFLASLWPKVVILFECLLLFLNPFAIPSRGPHIPTSPLPCCGFWTDSFMPPLQRRDMDLGSKLGSAEGMGSHGRIFWSLKLCSK